MIESQAKLKRVKKSYARRRKVADVTPRQSDSESPTKRKKKDRASEAIRKAIRGNNTTCNSDVRKTPVSGYPNVKRNNYCETEHTAFETIPLLKKTVRVIQELGLPT